MGGGNTREPAREQHATHDSPASTDKKSNAAKHLAVAPTIDLGDIEVGKHVFVDVPIFNLDVAAEAGASIHLAPTTKLDGTTPEIALISAPERVRPSREGFRQDQQIRLRFEPPAEGHFENSLTVTLAWRLGGPDSETVIVPVRGAAHIAGTSSWKERDAEAMERSAREQEQRMLERKTQANHDAVTSHFETKGMGDARQSFAAAYGRVFKHRLNAIDAAEGDASRYRRVIRHESEALERLAILGVELATALATAGVGAAVEAALSAVIEEEVIASIAADAVKEGVKSALTPHENGSVEVTGVEDATVIEFFRREKDMLADGELEAMRAANKVLDIFVPMFERDHKGAERVADLASRAIAASATSAGDAQKQQSSEHWVAYVAHTSLGGRKDNESLTNVEQANTAPHADGPTAWFDGLVDISFTASSHDPEQAPQVTSARLTGIAKNTVSFVASQPLLNATIPIRATGAPTDNEAVLALTVTRNEAKEISFTDGLGVPWMPSHWFERKGHGDPQRGARQLLDELLARPLGAKLVGDDVG
jgi:hypothetical protein